VAPIVAIVEDTFKIHPGTIDAHLTGKASGYSVANYVDLFTSKLARTGYGCTVLRIFQHQFAIGRPPVEASVILALVYNITVLTLLVRY